MARSRAHYRSQLRCPGQSLRARWGRRRLRECHRHLVTRSVPRDTPDDGREHPHRYPRWDTPPCPPPAGGWPHLDWGRGTRGRGVHNLDYDLGDLADTGAAVAVTTFRPSEDQAVLVVAAADRDAVEARLRPQLGRVLPDIADWAASLPDGILALEPWLRQPDPQPCDP